MPKFISEEEMAAIESESGSKFISDEEMSRLEGETNNGFYDKTKSFGLGLTQGATFGFGDELAGAAGAAVENVPIPFTNKSVYDYLKNKYAENVLGVAGASDLPTEETGSIGETYKSARDTARSLNDVSAQSNPNAHLAGEIVGGISTAMLPGVGGASGIFGKAGNIGSKIGRGSKILGGLGRGAAEGALAGGAYGLGTGEGSASSQIENMLGGATVGGLTGGAIGAATQIPGAISNKLGTVGKVAKVQKDIRTQIDRLKKVGGTVEADALESLSSKPMTEAGKALRRKAIMGPGERQAFQKKFFNQTDEVFKSVQDKKQAFDSSLRSQEAFKNLEGIPKDQPQMMSKAVLSDLKKQIDDAMPKGYTQKMVDDGLISPEMLRTDQDMRFMFDTGTLGHVRAQINSVVDDIDNAIDSYDVYDALNKAKQKIASLGDYGKTLDPIQRETSNIVRGAKKSLDSLLESEKVFGKQALRHKSVNEAYSRFINKTKNISNLLGQEFTDVGSRRNLIHPGKLQTYMVQVDELRGLQRKGPFDEWVAAAKEFSDVIDMGSQSSSDSTSNLLREFSKIKPDFEKTQGLHNQFRKLAWQQGVQNASTGGAGPIPGMAKMAGANRVPGVGSLIDAIEKGNKINLNTQDLIREMHIAEQSGGWAGDKIRKILSFSPQELGEFAPILQNAAAKGATSLAATNHVLTQQNPKYRQLQRKLNGQPEPK